MIEATQIILFRRREYNGPHSNGSGTKFRKTKRRMSKRKKLEHFSKHLMDRGNKLQNSCEAFKISYLEAQNNI